MLNSIQNIPWKSISFLKKHVIWLSAELMLTPSLISWYLTSPSTLWTIKHLMFSKPGDKSSTTKENWVSQGPLSNFLVDYWTSVNFSMFATSTSWSCCFLSMMAFCMSCWILFRSSYCWLFSMDKSRLSSSLCLTVYTRPVVLTSLK
jgi:hypothetical protein